MDIIQEVLLNLNIIAQVNMTPKYFGILVLKVYSELEEKCLKALSKKDILEPHLSHING